jgi:hypothetical protein
MQDDPGQDVQGAVTGEHQKLVIEETLRQVASRSDRRLFIKAALVGFFLALVVMIPATWVVGLELASVGDVERLASRNCTTVREISDIFEQDEVAEAAATRNFLKRGTLGLTKKELEQTLKNNAERDAVKIVRLRALAQSDCPKPKPEPKAKKGS